MAPTVLIFKKPTITQKIFADISNSECFPDRIGNVENVRKFLFLPFEKKMPLAAPISTKLNYFLALRGYFLYPISPISVNK
jgi:hypothetical protein